MQRRRLPAIREESEIYYGQPKTSRRGTSNSSNNNSDWDKRNNSRNREHLNNYNSYAIHAYRDFKLYEGKPSLIQPKSILQPKSYLKKMFSFDEVAFGFEPDKVITGEKAQWNSPQLMKIWIPLVIIVPMLFIIILGSVLTGDSAFVTGLSAMLPALFPIVIFGSVLYFAILFMLGKFKNSKMELKYVDAAAGLSIMELLRLGESTKPLIMLIQKKSKIAESQETFQQWLHLLKAVIQNNMATPVDSISLDNDELKKMVKTF